MTPGKKTKQFEEIVVWPLGRAALERAIYLTDHNRIKEIPADFRKQMGILLSRRDKGWPMVHKEEKCG